MKNVEQNKRVSEGIKMDDVLKRMLKTPPQPHDKTKVSGKEHPKTKPAK